MSLKEIKDQYALESNLNCWVEFVNKTHKRYLDHAYKEIAERYAQQRVNEVTNQRDKLIRLIENNIYAMELADEVEFLEEIHSSKALIMLIENK